MDAIVVQELHKRYGQVRALDGVSFAVREGEVFALLGPNGAGKSTTVRVLVTLTQPDSGRASVAGHDVRTDQNAVRRAIGYVPQDSGVSRLAEAESLTILLTTHYLEEADQLAGRLAIVSKGQGRRRGNADRVEGGPERRRRARGARERRHAGGE